MSFTTDYNDKMSALIGKRAQLQRIFILVNDGWNERAFVESADGSKVTADIEILQTKYDDWSKRKTEIEKRMVAVDTTIRHVHGSVDQRSYRQGLERTGILAEYNALMAETLNDPADSSGEEMTDDQTK